MRKKTKKIYSAILLLVMGSSVIGLMFSGFIFYGGHGLNDGNQRPQEAEFFDFEFVQKNNLWSTYINRREAVFTNLPQDVLFIQLDPQISQRIRSTVEIDTTYNGNDQNKESISLAIFQLNEMIRFHTNVFLRQGMDNFNEFNQPVITCDDATETVPVIYFQTGLTINVYSVGNCIIAESPDQNGFLMIKDRLLYSLLGILP